MRTADNGGGASDAIQPLIGLAHSSGIWELSAASDLGDAAWRRFLCELLSCQFQSSISSGCSLVGHIKAHLSTPTGSLRGSIVDDRAGPSVNGNMSDLSDRAKLTLNCVVYGLSEEVVHDIVAGCLKKTADAHGMHSS